MKKKGILPLFLSALLLVGCGSGSSEPPSSSETKGTSDAVSETSAVDSDAYETEELDKYGFGKTTGAYHGDTVTLKTEYNPELEGYYDIAMVNHDYAAQEIKFFKVALPGSKALAYFLMNEDDLEKDTFSVETYYRNGGVMVPYESESIAEKDIDVYFVMESLVAQPLELFVATFHRHNDDEWGVCLADGHYKGKDIVLFKWTSLTVISLVPGNFYFYRFVPEEGALYHFDLDFSDYFETTFYYWNKTTDEITVREDLETKAFDIDASKDGYCYIRLEAKREYTFGYDEVAAFTLSKIHEHIENEYGICDLCHTFLGQRFQETFVSFPFELGPHKRCHASTTSLSDYRYDYYIYQDNGEEGAVKLSHCYMYYANSFPDLDIYELEGRYIPNSDEDPVRQECSKRWGNVYHSFVNDSDETIHGTIVLKGVHVHENIDAAGFGMESKEYKGTDLTIGAKQTISAVKGGTFLYFRYPAEKGKRYYYSFENMEAESVSLRGVAEEGYVIGEATDLIVGRSPAPSKDGYNYLTIKLAKDVVMGSITVSYGEDEYVDAYGFGTKSRYYYGVTLVVGETYALPDINAGESFFLRFPVSTEEVYYKSGTNLVWSEISFYGRVEDAFSKYSMGTSSNPTPAAATDDGYNYIVITPQALTKNAAIVINVAA